MNCRDNSLEAIFHRRISRIIPKFFHRRLMDSFRRAVEIYQREGDGQLLGEHHPATQPVADTRQTAQN